jgi:hypothetical protein
MNIAKRKRNALPFIIPIATSKYKARGMGSGLNIFLITWWLGLLAESNLKSWIQHAHFRSTMSYRVTN